MKKITDKTYAFIDSQNLNLGIRDLGWRLDFQCLAKYLYDNSKLSAIMVPNQKKYSALLKFDIYKPYLRFVSDLQVKLEYAPQKKKSPRKDGTLKGSSSIGDTSIVAKNDENVNAFNRGRRFNKE